MNSIFFKVLFIIFILLYIYLDWLAVKKYKKKKLILIVFLVIFNFAAVNVLLNSYKSFPENLRLYLDEEIVVISFPAHYIHDGKHYYSRLTNTSTLNIYVDNYSYQSTYINKLIEEIEKNSSIIIARNDDMFIAYNQSNSTYTKYKLLFGKSDVIIFFVRGKSEDIFSIKDAETFFNYKKK